MVRGLPAGSKARDAWDCGKNVAAMVLAAHAAGVTGCAVHVRTPEVRLLHALRERLLYADEFRVCRPAGTAEN